MEYGIKISKIEQLENIPSKIKYVYFGNDLCERKMPSKEYCITILDFCKNKNLTGVFLTPFLTDSFIEKYIDLISSLSNYNFEVTINDLGLLNEINKLKNLTLNLGRLFIKMKKGPEIISGVLNQEISVFKKNSLFNPYFIPFYVSLGINSFEIDMPLQGIDLPNNALVNLYIGSSLISLTRQCDYANIEQKEYAYGINECSKECLNNHFIKKYSDFKEIFVIGNSEFVKTSLNLDLFLDKYFTKNNLKRVVFFRDIEDNLR